MFPGVQMLCVLETKSTSVRADGTHVIDAVTIGPPNDSEGHNLGHQLGFVMTFKSQGDRNFYGGSPLVAEEDSDLYCHPHDKFKDWIGDLLDQDLSRW